VVFAEDFPDPFILRVGNTYFAYATNASGYNVPALRSKYGFTQWERVGDALRRLPDWAAWHKNLTWAPSVLARGDRYVLYYTARAIKQDKQCISRAVADQPEGPYTDESEGPMICQVGEGGSIDPSPFVDQDGTPYLLWKSDGNCCGLRTYIYIQQLAEDGLSLVGEPVRLIFNNQSWEVPLVEGPSMLRVDRKYYLFYSANWYESDRYAIGYAVCESPLGPCEKPLDRPLVKSDDKFKGPGGQEFFEDEQGSLWVVFHSWTAPYTFYPEGKRSMHIAPARIVDGEPQLDAPIETALLAP
jgi:beta-xylosidase